MITSKSARCQFTLISELVVSGCLNLVFFWKGGAWKASLEIVFYQSDIWPVC